MQTENSLRKSSLLRGYSLTRADLVELYRLLQAHADEAGELEVRDFKLLDDQTLEQLDEQKEIVRGLFNVFVSIETDEGRTVSQGSEQILHQPDLPSNISRIEYDSANLYRQHLKSEPKNRTYVLLDFRKYHPGGIGFQPAEATPNDSQYSLDGIDTNWVRSGQSKIEDFFRTKKRRGTWLHGQGIYDILLQILGVFFIAWFMSFSIPQIDLYLSDTNATYRYAAYIFSFILALRLFAFLFSYARWIWPVVELEDTQIVIKAHRAIWFAMFCSLLAALLYDLF